MCLGYIPAPLSGRNEQASKTNREHDGAIMCTKSHHQCKRVKAGLSLVLYNAWKLPLFEVRFLTRILFVTVLAALKDVSPVYRKYAPCLCHAVAALFFFSVLI